MTSRPLRLLVVDDDTYLRILLSLGLPDAAFAEAGRLDEARDLAVSEQFDALIVDRRLPDGDGLDLVRELRKRDHPAASTPILVFTASHDEERRGEVLAAGADEYLAKIGEVGDFSGMRARIERLVALTPAERRARRKSLLARVRAGERGDLDAPPTPAPPAPGRRRWRRM